MCYILAMKLEDYIYYEGISQRELARRLDIHYRYMHGLISGEYTPGRKMALHIEEVTGGKVTALELLFPRPPKSAPVKASAVTTRFALDDTDMVDKKVLKRNSIDK
jgi:transcriptional regulator with XRE-family HTH domain